MGRDVEQRYKDAIKWLVSIHAPAWGATLSANVSKHSPHVSIHAPAWGATSASCWLVSDMVCFNPRARMGRDRGFKHLVYLGVQVSIHAPAWGATFFGVATPLPLACFNPRARMGRDELYRLHHAKRIRFNPRARMGRDCALAPRI